MELDRRSFLKGAALVGGGAALSGLVGCQPDSNSDASNETIVDEHIAPGMRATATLENAEPIPPEDPPAEWTGEADLVVVGTGGGGLAAALLAREQGASIIIVEKNATPGGASQHSMSLMNMAGTASDQIKVKYGFPESPYNRENFLRWIEGQYQFTIDDDLIGNMAETAGECLDWMMDRSAGLLSFSGMTYRPTAFGNKEVHQALSFKQITDKFYDLAVEQGAEFHFSTPCSALIVEDGRVVGIKASSSEGDMYFKGTKGVILCSGGFGMNPDMLKKYIPTAYKVAVHGGPMPYNTGECTRMALGVGADMAGYDSWNCWESELDNDTGDWYYFWGARQITQLPWLNIDARGKRCNFYKWLRTDAYDTDLPYAQDGTDPARTAVQVSRVGNRSYAIFDGKFEDYMWDISAPKLWERRPTSVDDPIPEQDLFNPDWRVEFENALEDGRFKQAETLEELAEKLGLDPQILKDSVDQWNKNCEAGVDSGTIYPLSGKLLHPIKEPPFYGAKIGGYLGKTLCGVRVDENLHVLDTKGKVIPGLYANFTTAGGAAGESTYGASILTTTFLGGNLLTWSTGYQATMSALSDGK